MKKWILMLLAASLLSGCMGTNGLTMKARKANLHCTENEWVREGAFLGMHALWVYRVTMILDLALFNSIEFWSGTNPINGKSALVDVPLDKVEALLGFNDVQQMQMERISEDTAKLYMGFDNGDKLTFDVLRKDDSFTVSYLGREFYNGDINPMAQL